MRAPIVGGVAGGVGTTTVATALHGTEAGRVDRRCDVVVCRGTGDSLRRAAALAEHLGPRPRPVLAVNSDGGCAGRGPLHARLRMIEPHFSAVVLLPRVGRWATLPEPLEEAAGLLAVPTRELPRALRPYALALHELATAVATAGRLHRTAPHAARRTPTSARVGPVEQVAVGAVPAEQAAALSAPAAPAPFPPPAGLAPAAPPRVLPCAAGAPASAPGTVTAGPQLRAAAAAGAGAAPGAVLPLPAADRGARPRRSVRILAPEPRPAPLPRLDGALG